MKRSKELMLINYKRALRAIASAYDVSMFGIEVDPQTETFKAFMDIGLFESDNPSNLIYSLAAASDGFGFNVTPHFTTEVWFELEDIGTEELTVLGFHRP